MGYAWKFADEAAFAVPGRQRSAFPDIQDELFWACYERCAPFSMVHITGFLDTYNALKHIRRNKIAGDFVECGCHMGGMGIFIALLNAEWQLGRRVILFDSFVGFPQGQDDALVWGAPVASVQYPSFLEDVQDNIAHVLGDATTVTLVPGMVEDTIPASDIDAIALLRLDTDFYASTKMELEHFYPRLQPGGALTIDDYGIFQGSRRATDEFLATLASPPRLNRIDAGVWSGVKP